MKLTDQQKRKQFIGNIDKKGPKLPTMKTRCWLWTASILANGYGQTKLVKGTTHAHRASYLTFVGEIPFGLQVLHECDNKACVNPKHLFLGTHQDNMTDMVNKGRSLKGDKNPSRKYPEKLARGLRNGQHTHPERTARGERHGSKTHPERVPRGDRHMSVTSPQSLKRGDRHYTRLKPELVLRGEKNGQSVLNEVQVRAIRKEAKPYVVTRKQLAKKYGVSIPTIDKILSKETWAHVD